MALSVKHKRSFASPYQDIHAKMCRNMINMNAAPISWPVPMRAIGAQNLLTMPGGVAISGYLHKKGGSQFSLMKWPLRYIIIHKGCVYYFKTSTSPAPQGAFSLNGYNRVMRAAEETTSSNVFPFKIVHFSKRHRTWYFSAASEDERRKWMRYLRKEISQYNDKKDWLDPSDSDSDESFYGPIESPMEINNAPEDPEGDGSFFYGEPNDESDEDDYLMPDEPAGQPKAPPPSYPPPPVPHHPKGPPPPVPNKAPPSPFQKKPLSPVPRPPKPSESVNKGPPPVPAGPPPLHNLGFTRTTVVPGTFPMCQKKTVGGSVSCTTLPGYEWKPHPATAIKTPSTLPICEDLENKLVLNSHSRSTPGERKPLGLKPPPKCPPPGIKPKLSPQSLQRSLPDGQSFRSSIEEKPLKKRIISNTDEDSDDDDYENVQLPDSVFVDTSETSAVEKLFKETTRSPPDGLYCIRNSGTKTSKVLVVWDVSLNKARNYRLFEEEEIVYLEAGLNFPSISALVEYYYSHPLPNHGSLCLQQPFGYTPPR